MMLELKQSQIGCHIKNVYMGALAYTDDSVICPSIRGMNKMLEICNTFAESNHIYFNTRKTICSKFGKEKNITKKLY